jgi:hypothetical protein
LWVFLSTEGKTRFSHGFVLAADLGYFIRILSNSFLHLSYLLWLQLVFEAIGCKDEALQGSLDIVTQINFRVWVSVSELFSESKQFSLLV